MPRLPRLNLPGLFHHVMVRGIERRSIFRSTDDRYDFLRRLGDGLKRSGCRCYAWALMTNHLHLLILSGLRGLVSLMHPLLTGYAVNFNIRYRRVGHLFQNRYKSILCEEDPYFLEIVRYIALQPVRAGIVKTEAELADYEWTSHPSILGRTPSDWLEVDEVLGRFGRQHEASLLAYRQFLRDGWSQGRRPDLEGGGLLRSVGGINNALQLRRLGKRQMNDVRILGSGDFVERILREADQEENLQAHMRKQWTLPALTQAVCAFYEIPSERLAQSTRQRSVSNARAVLSCVAREWLGIKGSRLQRLLGLSSAGLSKGYEKGRELLVDGRVVNFLNRKQVSNVP